MKIIPVFYSADAEMAKNIVRACYKGGIRVFEFTNRGSAAGEVFEELVRMAAAECPEMELGIGSIVDGESCRRFVGTGAKFVVGPVFSADVMDVARELSVPYIPGAATPTEIFNAHRLGAPMVKVFPAAELGGPAFVKAVLAPMPWLPIMVTGGVEPTVENLTAWFRAGAKCVGIGSNLFPKELVAAGKWDEITELCTKTVTIVTDLKH